MEIYQIIKKSIIEILGLAALLLIGAYYIGVTHWYIAIIICILGQLTYVFYKAYHIQRKKLKESLKPIESVNQSNQVLSHYIKAQIFPTLLINQQDQITHLNLALLNAFIENASDAQLPNYIGAHYSSLLRIPQVITVYEQVKRDGMAAQFDFELTNHVERHFSLNIKPIKITDSEILYCFTFRDLTKDQQLDQMRADFVANASHELRTPLASISGFIETLQGPAQDDINARTQFLSIMQEQAKRMRRLIDDLLSLSQLEMNLHIKPQQSTNLYDICYSCFNSLELLAKERNITLEFNAEIKIAMIKGDHDQLVQLLNNLLDNAFKYGQIATRVENKVILSLTQAPNTNQFTISVTDFGRGIAEQDLPRLTERFYRISSAHKTRGTGLGLAIVKHIVARHSGEIKFQSKLGDGTKVSLYFNKVL